MRKGEWVRDTAYDRVGRIYKMHETCPQDDFWISMQNVPITDAELAETWASVLIHGGGAVVTPISRLTIIDPIEDFVHTGTATEFDDVDALDAEITAIHGVAVSTAVAAVESVRQEFPELEWVIDDNGQLVVWVASINNI